MDAVRLVDMLGPAQAAFCGAQTRAPFPVAHVLPRPHGWGQAYLIDEMDNHIGAVTRIGYARLRGSTWRMSSGETRWKTPLPFQSRCGPRRGDRRHLGGSSPPILLSPRLLGWSGPEFRGFGRVTSGTAKPSTNSTPPAASSGSPLQQRTGVSYSPPTRRAPVSSRVIGDEFGTGGRPISAPNSGRSDGTLQ